MPDCCDKARAAALEEAIELCLSRARLWVGLDYPFAEGYRDACTDRAADIRKLKTKEGGK